MPSARGGAREPERISAALGGHTYWAHVRHLPLDAAIRRK